MSWRKFFGRKRADADLVLQAVGERAILTQRQQLPDDDEQ